MGKSKRSKLGAGPGRPAGLRNRRFNLSWLEDERVRPTIEGIVKAELEKAGGLRAMGRVREKKLKRAMELLSGILTRAFDADPTAAYFRPTAQAMEANQRALSELSAALAAAKIQAPDDADNPTPSIGHALVRHALGAEDTERDFTFDEALALNRQLSAVGCLSIEDVAFEMRAAREEGRQEDYNRLHGQRLL